MVITFVTMSLPACLLRNIRHPANSIDTPFDDLEVEFLASLFLRYRSVFNVDPASVVTAFTGILREFHGDGQRQIDQPVKHMTSYTTLKLRYGQDCQRITEQDTLTLLQHFSRLNPVILRPWSELLSPKINQAILGKAALYGDFICVSPVVRKCLFCDTTLDDRSLKVIGGDRSIGGRSWSYTFEHGACVALVVQRRCPDCGSTYNLQTYTPGPKIMDEIGMTWISLLFFLACLNLLQMVSCSTSLVAGYPDVQLSNILLPYDVQNTQWFQVSVATIIEYKILSLWHSLKMHSLCLSYESFSNTLATKWGIHSRDKAGTAPPPDKIPLKTSGVMAAQRTNQGPRYLLQSKRLTDAIIKGSIVSVINQHFLGKSPPKYASLPLCKFVL